MQAAQRKIDYNTSFPQRKKTVKMRGNVAYINNEYFEEKQQQKQTEKKSHQTKLKTLPKKKAAVKKAEKKGLVSTLLVVFVGFCALALLVSRHADIVRIGTKNSALQKQIAELEAKVDDLEVKLELKSTLEAVQSTARQELGMKYPVDNEKIHVEINSR